MIIPGRITVKICIFISCSMIPANCAAHLIGNKNKFENSTSLLPLLRLCFTNDMTWLPLILRLKMKINCFISQFELLVSVGVVVLPPPPPPPTYTHIPTTTSTACVPRQQWPPPARFNSFSSVSLADNEPEPSAHNLSPPSPPQTGELCLVPGDLEPPWHWHWLALMRRQAARRESPVTTVVPLWYHADQTNTTTSLSVWQILNFSFSLSYHHLTGL